MTDDSTLIREMIRYDRLDPKRIHHFLKVYEFACLIADGEHADGETAACVHAAAIVHDIGIHLSEQKYGSGSGKYQEIEGPAEARIMLSKLGYPPALVDRVAYLVGHHHTYTAVDGLDYQILIEADFLVNLYEDCAPGAPMHEAARAAYTGLFKTETGRTLCRDLYESGNWE
jgi:uncharacterized protein